MMISSVMIYDPVRGLLFPRTGVVNIDASIVTGQLFRALLVQAIGWAFVIVGAHGIFSHGRNR